VRLLTPSSCFAAASLQCLAAARPFTAYLLSRPHPRCGRASCVLCLLCEVLEAMEAEDGGPAPSLGPLVSSIRRVGSHFQAYRQEDAHDLVQALLDKAHTTLLDDLGGELRFDPLTRETSGIFHLCGGVQRGTVRCLACGAVSHRYENFLTLSLEVSGRIASVEAALAANFCGSEELKGREAYRCDACNALVTGRKSARLAVPPNVLVLTLKRYTTGFFGKVRSEERARLCISHLPNNRSTRR